MVGIDELRSLGTGPVHVRLADGSVHAGRLRTDLLSEHAVSIFLDDGGEGATLYIHEIVAASSDPAAGQSLT
jgi:hypothetical protein